MWPSDIQIVLYLVLYSVIFSLICFFFRNKKISGKALKEYLWPIKFCLVGAMIGVSVGYLSIFSPETAGLVSQVIWMAMSFFSALILVYYHNFTLKNMVVLGGLCSLWIHGAKCSLRYVVYGSFYPLYRTIEYIGGRFVYGSILVFSVVFVSAVAIFLNNELNKKPIDVKKISIFVSSIILTCDLIFVAAKIYNPSWSLDLSSRGPILATIILLAIVGGIIGEYIEHRMKTKKRTIREPLL